MAKKIGDKIKVVLKRGTHEVEISGEVKEIRKNWGNKIDYLVVEGKTQPFWTREEEVTKNPTSASKK